MQTNFDSAVLFGNFPVGINNEGLSFCDLDGPERDQCAIGSGHLALGVGQEWKIESVMFSKLLMLVLVARVYANDAAI